MIICKSPRNGVVPHPCFSKMPTRMFKVSNRETEVSLEYSRGKWRKGPRKRHSQTCIVLHANEPQLTDPSISSRRPAGAGGRPGEAKRDASGGKARQRTSRAGRHVTRRCWRASAPRFEEPSCLYLPTRHALEKD